MKYGLRPILTGVAARTPFVRRRCAPVREDSSRPARRLFLFGLAPDGFLGRRDGGLVAEETAAERLQLLVEFVENRDAGRDVELHDVALGHHVEHLDQGAQRVSVRHDEYVLAGSKLRDYA